MRKFVPLCAVGIFAVAGGIFIFSDLAFASLPQFDTTIPFVQEIKNYINHQPEFDFVSDVAVTPRDFSESLITETSSSGSSNLVAVVRHSLAKAKDGILSVAYHVAEFFKPKQIVEIKSIETTTAFRKVADVFDAVRGVLIAVGDVAADANGAARRLFYQLVGKEDIAHVVAERKSTEIGGEPILLLAQVGTLPIEESARELLEKAKSFKPQYLDATSQEQNVIPKEAPPVAGEAPALETLARDVQEANRLINTLNALLGRIGSNAEHTARSVSDAFNDILGAPPAPSQMVVPIPQPSGIAEQPTPTAPTGPVQEVVRERIVERQPIIQEIRLNIPTLPPGYFAGVQGGVSQPSINQQIVRETVVETRTVTDNSALNALSQSVQQQIASLQQVIGQSAPTAATLSITDSDVPDTITVSNYLLLAGGNLHGNFTVATNSVGFGTTSPWGTLAVEQIASGDELFPALVVGDTGTKTPALIVLNGTGNVGIGTNTPSQQLSVAGNLLVGGTATNTFENGIKLNTGCFLMPDGSCAGSGSALGNITELTNFISVSYPASTTPYAVLGVEHIDSGDEELAAFVVSDSGSTSPSLIVLNGTGNVGLGTSSPLSHQLALSNQLLVGGTGTSTIEGGLLLSTAAGNVGIGTGSPSYALSVAGNLLLGGTATNTFENGIKLNTGCFLMPDGSCAGSGSALGNITELTNFISVSYPASTTPYAVLGVEHIDSGDEELAAFVVSDSGSTSPSLIVLNSTGFVGIATASPGSLFAVQGLANLGSLTVEGSLKTSFLVATSTTASSTLPQLSATSLTTTGLTVLGDLTVESTGTSSIPRVLSTDIAATSLTLSGALDVGGIGTTTIPTFLATDVALTGLTITGDLNVEATGTSTIPRASFTDINTGSLTLSDTLEVTSTGTSTIPRITSTDLNTTGLVVSGELNVESGASSTIASFNATDINTASLTLTGTLESTTLGTSTFAGGINLTDLIVSSGLRVDSGTAIFDENIEVARKIKLSDALQFSSSDAWYDVLADYADVTTLRGMTSSGIQFDTESDGVYDIFFKSGDVGIGTNTPGYKLSVHGAGEFHGGLYVEATSTASSLIATSTFEVRGWGGADTPDFNVMDGKVGIATATPAALFAMQLLTQGDADLPGFAVYPASGAIPDLIVLNDSGFVGLATETPGSRFSVQGLANLGSLTVEGSLKTSFLVATSTTASGFGTTSPWGFLSIEQQASGDEDLPAFIIGDTGTKTPALIVMNATGKVGTGTTSPLAQLSVETTAGNIGFAVGSSTATNFIVNEKGWVGISNADPVWGLHVGNGSASPGLGSENKAESVFIEGRLEVDSGAQFDSFVQFNSYQSFANDGFIYFNTGDDLSVVRSNSSRGGGLDIGLATDPTYMVVTTYANHATDHEHADQTNPTIFIHSATSPSTDPKEYLSLTHDATNAVIDTGVGNILTNTGFIVATTTVNSGFASATPWGVLTVEQVDSGDELLPAFVVGDTGTKSPAFIVLNHSNVVGVGTNTPGSLFAVQGLANLGSLTVEGSLKTSFLVATSTTASSTLPQLSATSLTTTGLTVLGDLTVESTGTSSVPRVLSTDLAATSLTLTGDLNVEATGTSTIPRASFTDINAGSLTLTDTLESTTLGTSTFAGGINLTDLIVSSGLRVDSGTAIFDEDVEVGGNLGIGTSSPGAKFAVQGLANLGSLTVEGSLKTSFLVATSTTASGFGTTSPWGFLSIEHPSSGDEELPAFVVADQGTSTASLIVLNQNGYVGVGTNTPWAVLSVEIPAISDERAAAFVVGDEGTSTPALAVYSSGITAIEQLQTGVMSFDTNAGAVTWVDLPVTSGATWGTIERYTAQIDTTNIFTVYAESDGKGGIINEKVGVGTTTPGGRLSVAHSSTTPALLLDQTDDGDLLTLLSAGQTVFSVKGGGKTVLGIASTTPGAGLVVSTSTIFSDFTTFYVEGTSTVGSLIATSTLSVASSSPTAEFSVVGLSVFGGDLNVTGQLDVQSAATSTIGAAEIGALEINSGGLRVNVGDAVFDQKIVISGTATSTFAGGINLTDLIVSSGLRVDSGTAIFDEDVTISGNLGIGTDTPGYKLSVHGAGEFHGGLYVEATTTTSSLIATSTLEVRGVSGSDLFVTNGRVGIATSSPWGTLAVEQVADDESDNELFPAFVVSDTGTSAPAFIVLNGPRKKVGIGTTSPTSALEVKGRALISGNLTVEGNLKVSGVVSTSTAPTGFASGTPWGTFSIEQIDSGDEELPAFVVADQGTSTASLIVLNQNGYVGVGTNTPWAVLSVEIPAISDERAAAFVVGDEGTSTPALAVYSSGITAIEQLQTGVMSFDTNAGAVTWIDMPVTTGAVWGTAESYTAQIDTTNIFTVYAESDGKGGIINEKVGVGTTTPGGRLSVAHSSTTPALLLDQTDDGDLLTLLSAGQTVFSVKGGGKTVLGIASTTPGAGLVVSTSTIFSDFTTFYVEGTSTVGSLIATSTLEVRGAAADASAPNFYVSEEGGISIGTTTTAGGRGILLAGDETSSGVNRAMLSLFDNTGKSQWNIFVAGETTSGQPSGEFSINRSGTIEGSNANSRFVIDTGGRVGFGTVTPWGVVSIEHYNATSTNSEDFPVFAVSDSGTATPSFVIKNADGYVGIATSSPWGRLAIEMTTDADSSTSEILPAFVVGDQGSNTPFFMVMNGTGRVAMGTTSPQGVIAVMSADTVPALLISAAGTGDGNVAIAVASNDVCDDGTADGPCALNDLAELYPFSEPLEKGDIVMLDSENPLHLKKAVNSATSEVQNLPLAGVVSASPAIVFEGSSIKTLGGVYQTGEDKVPLSLAGRVPVKVNLENGEIKIGDPITVSSIAGVGAKATKSGRIIGYALQNLSRATTTPGVYDKINLLITNGFWLAPDYLANNLSSSDSASPSIISSILDAVIDWLKSAVVSVKEIVTERLAALKLQVGTPEKPTGITIYDINTSQPYCIAVRDGKIENIPGECTFEKSSASPEAPTNGTPDVQNADSPNQTNPPSDVEPPVIQLNGLNPSTIDKGSVYAEQGAVVTDNVNDNLGYKIKLDGGPEIYPNELNLDTSIAGEHTITYVAVDQAGNIGTAVRTIVVVDPNVENPPAPVEEPAPPSESAPAEEPAPL